MYFLPFQQFTGQWLKGPQVPVDFVTPIDYYVFDKILMIRAIPSVYIYVSDLNLWRNVIIEINCELRLNIRQLYEMPKKFMTASCYIGKY